MTPQPSPTPRPMPSGLKQLLNTIYQSMLAHPEWYKDLQPQTSEAEEEHEAEQVTE